MTRKMKIVGMIFIFLIIKGGSLVYKQSCHNLIYRDQEKILIFNRRTKKYIKATYAKNEVESILCKENINDINSHILRKLADAGILVNSDLDELSDLKLFQNDYINNPRLSICVLPTEKCNFRCVYCYENFAYGSMALETQNALLLWIKKNIKNYSGLEVRWFGGEPLLEKEIIYYLSEEMINICKLAKKPYAASITTNGSLMDVDTFRKLLKCHITNFQVTIDGPEKIHDRLKVKADGSGTYANIMKNLIIIKQKVRSSVFRIIIRTNVTNDVALHISSHIKDLNTMFGNDNRFIFYFRPVGRWGDSKNIEIEDELLDSFDSIYAPILESNIILNYSVYLSLLEDQICFAAKRNQYVIRSDGRIAKCTMMLERDENTIGYLLADGMMQIDSAKLQRWVIPFKPLSDKCKACNMVLSCMEKSCPAKGYVIKNTDMCGYEHKSYSYIMQLLDKNNMFESID